MNKGLFFIADAWNYGLGVIIEGYDFLVTTAQTIGKSENILIKTSKNERLSGKVYFIDNLKNIAFIKTEAKQNSVFDLSKIDTGFEYGNVKVISMNFLCEPNEYEDEISTNFLVDQMKYKYLNSDKKYLDGSLVITEKHELIGIVGTFYNESKKIVIPFKYILNTLEEFSSVSSKAIRCPTCENIVTKTDVEEYICPRCNSLIPEELMTFTIPKLNNINSFIEKSILKFGYEIDLCRIGKNFWEIYRDNISVYINYDHENDFITAFTYILEVDNQKNTKLFEFLLNENIKNDIFSFSFNKNKIILSTPYYVTENFSSGYSQWLVNSLFEKAKYYNNLLKNKVNEQ